MINAIAVSATDTHATVALERFGLRALVAASRDGDAAATRALYERHAVRVRAVLFRILHDAVDVDDALQEAFVRGFAKLSTLENPDAFGAWMTTIAVNVARRHLRSQKRRAWLAFLAPEDLPDVENVTTASADERDAARATEAILRGFPVDERIAFSLRFIQGMALDEVAQATSVSLATCKRRIARASTRMRDEARTHPALKRYVGGAS